MSLNLSSCEAAKPAKSPTPKMPRLPASYLPMITEYAGAVERKKTADAESRAAESVVKQHRATLAAAMDGATTAICGHAVLTLSQTADQAAALTLTSGEKVLWSGVTSVLVGNRHIPMAEIQTLFGGRSGSLRLDVKGV